MGFKDYSNIVSKTSTSNNSRKNAWKKSREEAKSSSSSSSSSSYSSSSGYKDFSYVVDRQKLSKTINMDTFQSDMENTINTINNIYSGWQTKETMANTLSSVQSMYDRIGKYQEYQKKYGGADLTELQNSYKNVLDGWEDISKHYGKYESAEAYTNALKAAEKSAIEHEGMKTADLSAVQKDINDLEAKIKKAKDLEFSWAHYSSARTSENAQKIATEAKEQLNQTLKELGYATVKEAEKALGEKKVYKNKAEWIQKGIKLSSVGDETSENYDKDFSEKSKYVAPKERSGFRFEFGAQDEDIYKYINDESYRTDKAKFVNGSADASILTVGYEYMTDKEKQIYNYYYNTVSKEKANEYLDTITEELGYRKASDDFGRIENKTFSELSFGAAAGLDQFASGIKNLFNSSDEYIPVNSTQQLSGMIREDLKYNHGTLGQVGYDLINTTSNMLPSILLSTIAPVGGSAIGAASMGMSAGGNAYQEMLNLGYDKGQARTYSTLVGVSEAGLQHLMGGIGKLGGTSAKLSKAVSGIDNALAKFAIQWGGSALSEGFEEAAQEVLNPLFMNMAAGFDTGEEVNWEEVVYSGLLGALSGGLLEGAPLAINSASEHRFNTNMGANIKANEKVGDIFDIASNPEVAQAYEAYTKYAKKGINADNISNAQLGNLYASAKTDTLNTLGSKTSTDEQRTTAFQNSFKLDEIDTAIQENTQKKEAQKELEKTAKKNFNVDRNADESVITKTGKVLNYKDINIGKDKVTVASENGDISIDDATLSMRDAELVEMASRIAKEEGENLANTFLHNYDNKTSLDEYQNSFNLAIAYAKNDFSYNHIFEHKGSLSAEMASEIYQEVTVKAAKEQAQKITELNQKMADAKFYKGVIDDSAIDYNNTSAEGKVNWQDLTEKQRKAVTFVKGFAQAAGMNLAFVANNPNYNGKYDRNTNTIYINLDKGGFDYANNLKESIIPSMSHETTHWMKSKSPELWTKLNEVVFSTLVEHHNKNITEDSQKITEEDLINREYLRLVARDKKNGKKIDKKALEDEAREEIISRACEDILSMSTQGRKIFNSLSVKEQNTLSGKIKEIITNLLDWVDDLLHSYKSNSPEAKILREYKDSLNKAIEIWDEMLEQSVVANQSLEKSVAYRGNKSAQDKVLEKAKKLQLKDPTKLTEKDFKELLGFVENKLFSDDTFIPARINTPQILIAFAKEHGYILENYPLAMRVYKARQALSNEAEWDGNPKDKPHDLTAEEVVDIVKAMNNPSHLVYQTRNDRFAEIVKFQKNGSKNKAYAIIDFFDVEKNPDIMNGFEGGKYNILVTIYPSEDSNELKKYLKDKNNIVMTSEEMKKKGISQGSYDSYVSSLLNDLPFYENIITEPETEVKENLSTKDSTGRELSKGQQEYFKESTVRDDNGNLLVMYRGDSTDFDVFDRKKTKHSNLYGRGFYFTNSKAHAGQYGNAREFYLDIKHPLSPKQNAITKKQMLNFLKAIENDGEDYDLYNYGQDATAESVLKSVWGKGDFEMLQDVNAGAIGDLVAAVELFNEVNGTNYDGIVLPTETVTFNSEQAKLTSNLNPTKDKNMRFSMKENVEETKDLIAVHNLSPEKLSKTLKLGGLPMPSIAITRAREGYNNFGDISLIFGKDTIDPKLLRSNKVYSGDAWTPTYPRIAYKVNDKVADKIREKINAIVPKNVQNDLGGLHLDSTNLESELNRHGDMVNSYRYNYPMKYAFLKDNNVTIELPTKEEPFYSYGKFSNRAVFSFANKLVEGLKTANSLYEQHSSKLMADEELLNSIATALNEDAMSSVEEDSEAYQKLVENPLFKPEDIDLSTVLGMLEASRKYFHSNGKAESKIDYRNARTKIDDYFDSHSLEKDYEYWLKNLFSDIIAKEGIRNNKDLFTPSGNRRSFEALHYEHTLENVVKAMKEEGAKGIGGFGGGNIFGASTNEYNSIDEIKSDAENRMYYLPESEYEEIRKGFRDRLYELANTLPIHKDSFSALDDATNMLIEAVSKFKTKSGMANYLRTESKGWANYSDYIVDDLIELVNDIRNMPAQYFEAKPQRAVGFDEIKAVVMPSQESYEDDLSEVKSELEKLNIPILEYEYGDNNARIKALNSLEDVRFSEKNVDSEGNALSKEQIEFFKESKVRDADGNLLICYHGTYEDFSVFDISKTMNANAFGKGHYFTNKKTDAQDNYASGKGADVHTKIESLAWTYFYEMGYTEADYESNDAVSEWNEAYDRAEEFYKKGKVVQAYLNIKNPVYAQGSELYDSNGNFVSARSAEYLKELGYDGIIDYGVSERFGHFQELDDDTVHYIVFDSNQIKLTTNTKPTENEDIRYSDKDYVAYDTTAILKESTIDEYLKAYASESTPNYAQAYITYMSPREFLQLTTKNAESQYYIEKESKKLNREEFEAYTQFQPIQLKIDHQTGEVTSHEGRHRMVALSREDIYDVPVLLFDYSNKTSKEILNDLTLKGQFNEYRIAIVDEAIPFSYANRDLIIEKFGTQSREQKIRERYGINETLRYSEKSESIYDIMGERDRLIKEQEKFIAEIERLNERLKLERKVTGGNQFNQNQLGAVAGHLRNISQSNMDKVELMKALKELYTFIATSENLSWEEIYEKSYRIAENMLSEAKPLTISDDYAKSLLKEIRNTRISLDESQKKEASYIFDKHWNRNFMGKVIIADNGTPIEVKWQEWHSLYPDVFADDISDGDKIRELYDIIESLRASSETVDKYAIAEQTRWLANEIYNQYWNVSPIRTTADKYDKQIKRLNSEHRNAMNELRNDFQKRLYEKGLADDIYYGGKLGEQKTKYESKLAEKKAQIEKQKELYRKLRERKDQEIAIAKQHGKDLVSKYKDNAQRKTYIQRITANALTLNKWLTKNSKDYHIHEAMKGPVIKLLNAIDFSSKTKLESGEMTQKDISFAEAFSEVKAMLQDADNMVEGLEALYGHDLSEKIELITKASFRLVGDNNYVINAMSSSELESLDYLVTEIKRVVTDMNKFHTVQHSKGAVNLANEFMEHGEKIGNIKKQHGTMAKFFEFRNRTPYYFFKDLGDVGVKLFNAFQDGWDKLAFNAKQIIDYSEETYTTKEVQEWSKETKKFNLLQKNGETRTFEMSIAQIMALHCVAKQKDAKTHLLSGGMTLKRFDSKGHVITDYENITLAVSDIQTILGSLTDRQREVADKLQEFMNTVCSEWGNEISMARFGIKMFGIPDYFPIKVSEATVPTDNTKDIDNASLFRLLNMSFTKSRNKNAKQSIEIGDIFDIFAQHSSDMAKYNALALPVLDFNKFYSIHGADFNGKEYGVVKTLKSVFGDEANGYIRRFVRDINGSQNVSRDVIGNTFFKNAKLASVAANLRVVLLQPTAFHKASAIMDNKYLLKASAYIKVEPISMVKKLKKAIANAEKYCGIVQWKALGYYDTDISKGLTDKIKHADTWKDKLIEKSMKGAEIADKATFGTLWVACEFEIKDTRKDLKVGSKEYYDAIAERLRDVIYATQVVDSTMTRSDMMRSADGKDKMLTAFGSEPTIAYNMLLDLATTLNRDKKMYGSKEARRRNSKKIRKVVTAYVITNAVAALVESGFDALRDDEEEMDVAEFMKLYFKNFYFDLSIGNKLPYIKEIYSFLQGYSSSRLDAQWIQSANYIMKDIKKVAEGEGDVLKLTKDSLKAMSYISGLPAYNVFRDAMAVLDKLGIIEEE